MTLYDPLPVHVPAMLDTSPVCLLTGSAGGGKSRAAAEKLHAFMLHYPGATGLVLRKAREHVEKSAVPMLWHTVMGGETSGIRMLKSDNLFEYKNGSTLFWGGMLSDDQREALRSIGRDGALDIVWIEEANALTENDFNEISGRMRGNAAPWRQILPTTNPDAPNHWINQRLILRREANVYYSSARDNPYNPPDYLNRLDTMTGMLYDRLVKGLWVTSEGAIYPNFSLEENVTEEAEYNPALPVWWFADDGFACGAGKGTESYHPRVFIFAQLTQQGEIHVFAEYVKCGELEETSIANALAMPDPANPYPKPELCYIDSSAVQLANRIAWNFDIYTIPATHDVANGIKNLRRMIGSEGNKRLLKIHPRCIETIAEFQSYRYDSSRVVNVGEPQPLRVDDHCVSAVRYGAWSQRFE